MNSFDRAIERFCYRHPRFGIRNLMLYIIAGTGVVYLLSIMDTTGTFLQFICFYPDAIFKGQIWRLVTFLFMPAYASAADIFWMAISLYFYYFIGSSLERQWGPGRFTIYYFTGIILNVLFGFILHFLGFGLLTVGLSGHSLNISLFLAFAVLWPDHRVYLFFVLPVKIKWLGILDAILLLYDVVSNMSLFPINLQPVVAILNFLIFCTPSLIKGFKRDVNYHSRVINFREASRRTEREQNIRGYRHKCSVCGKTDTDHPELEFRYCSRCAGYHCFCEEHINNHVHFTE